ncbi:hypothetical protein M8C21_022829, partial [Ambrosia artemisiifolia]
TSPDGTSCPIDNETWQFLSLISHHHISDASSFHTHTNCLFFTTTGYSTASIFLAGSITHYPPIIVRNMDHVVGGKFKLGRKIGSGSFGELFQYFLYESVKYGSSDYLTNIVAELESASQLKAAVSDLKDLKASLALLRVAVPTSSPECYK